MVERSTLKRTSTSKVQRTSGRRGRMVGKGCYDTLSSGYDSVQEVTAAVVSCTRLGPRPFHRGGTHEAPPLTEELCVVNSFGEVNRFFLQWCS